MTRLPLCVLLYCGLIAITSVGYAQDAQELARINRELVALQQELNQYEGEYAESQEQVRQEELKVAAIRREIISTQQSISASEVVIRSLQARWDELNQSKLQQQASIRSEIAAAYRNGPEEPLKMLLNQTDPSEFSRMMQYYRRILEARQAVIERYQTTLVEIETNELAQQETWSRQQVLLLTLSDQEDDLLEGVAAREVAVERLEVQLADTRALIEKKMEDRRRLEQLVNRITERMAELDIEMPTAVRDFADIKGQCQWPAQGQISARYGSTRAGDLRWNGVMLSAPEGSDVRAVHAGRVVFADYLRGYGLLVIVDHNNEYLTLYGHNQAIYVDAGQSIASGERIASVGDTGGQREMALYFEIRHQGRPQNPASWCR